MSEHSYLLKIIGPLLHLVISDPVHHACLSLGACIILKQLNNVLTMLPQVSFAWPSRYTPCLIYTSLLCTPKTDLQRPEPCVESSHAGRVPWPRFNAPVRWPYPVSERFLWCLPLWIIVRFSTLSWRGIRRASSRVRIGGSRVSGTVVDTW